MRRKRLTPKIIDGLKSMMANVDAGGPEDLGLEGDQEGYDAVMAAVDWIASLPSPPSDEARRDRESMASEKRDVADGEKLCRCGHRADNHLDWGGIGACDFSQCDCKKWEDV